MKLEYNLPQEIFPTSGDQYRQAQVFILLSHEVKSRQIGQGSSIIVNCLPCIPKKLSQGEGTPPLARFFGAQKNSVKGKLRYRRSILVLKHENGTFLLLKSTF